MSDPRAMRLSIGDILASKYRVERHLGDGVRGIVIAAHHIQLGELYAVKLMYPAYSSDPQALERFMSEVRAAAKLKSEHAVRIYEVGKLENGVLYIAMEFISGEDLHTYVEGGGQYGGPHSIDRAVLLVLQACSAIAEAHAAGIIHRALKPSNVLVTAKSNGLPYIKVLDFGISRAAGMSYADSLHGMDGASLANTSVPVGSPFYTSPEQMLSSDDVDHRTDIWSLGVILYELITGQLPFVGSSLPWVIRGVLEGGVTPPSALRRDLPPGLETIILRCLEKDPKQRIASVAELMEHLEPFAMTDGFTARTRFIPRDELAESVSQGAPESSSPDTLPAPLEERE